MRNSLTRIRLMVVYTLGYQGFDLETYIETLVSVGVGVVLDVRETAWSYKRGFSKSPLQKALVAAGIGYVHLRSAGNPSVNRKSAKTIRQCLARYRRHLAKNEHCLDEILRRIREAGEDGHPSCLTCYERAASDCHRSILIEALKVRFPRLKAIHLPTLLKQSSSRSLRIP